METRQCAAELSKGPDRAAVVQRDEGVPSVERHNLKVHVAKALGVHKTLLRCWDAGPSRTGIGWSDKGKEEF